MGSVKDRCHLDARQKLECLPIVLFAYSNLQTIEASPFFTEDHGDPGGPRRP